MAEEDAKPRILVVDDDPALQKLVLQLLERGGFSPVGALTAKEAAAVLKEKPLPALMVLDLMLPEMSGIDFLKQIRNREEFEALPVIILSALADPQQIRDGLAAGADRYLTKPYLANNLIKTVREVLQQGRVKR